MRLSGKSRNFSLTVQQKFIRGCYINALANQCWGPAKLNRISSHALTELLLSLSAPRVPPCCMMSVFTARSLPASVTALHSVCVSQPRELATRAAIQALRRAHLQSALHIARLSGDWVGPIFNSPPVTGAQRSLIEMANGAKRQVGVNQQRWAIVVARVHFPSPFSSAALFSTPSTVFFFNYYLFFI